MSGADQVLYDTDFATAIARNKRNTVALFIVLLAIGAAAGYVLGWGVAILELIWRLPADQVQRLTPGAVLADLFGPPRPYAIAGAGILSGTGLVWGVICLLNGEDILTSFAGARDADPSIPAERRFIDIVAEMAIAAGMPMPRAMVVDTPAMNAFAAGFSPQRAVITATSGIIEACTREELQGVVGHEMGHVADYDIRYTTVVAAMAGVLVLLSHFLGSIVRNSFGWGPRVPYATRRSGSDSSGGQRLLLTLIVLAVLVVVLIVAPLAARLVQMAISRQREFLADATSVKYTRNPLGLIHALERLARGETDIARSSSPVSALCIAEPKRRSFISFSTHPETEDRIMRLRNLGGHGTPGEPSEDPPAAAAHSFLPDAGNNPWVPPPADQSPPSRGPWG